MTEEALVYLEQLFRADLSSEVRMQKAQMLIDEVRMLQKENARLQERFEGCVRIIGDIQTLTRIYTG